MYEFPTDYQSILSRLNSIDPALYASTRNYLSGATTKLSAYLTHGVITTQDVGNIALGKASYAASQVLLKELAWHDFYFASWDQLGNTIFSDLRYPQTYNQYPDLPAAVATAATGISVIDQSITELIDTGYMHNHSRLWLAMLCCNVAKTAWWNPSRWLYYHLLDGNIASNTLSWQWVAGSSRQLPYFANQENLNTYSGISQRQTFLDYSYEDLAQNKVPPILEERIELVLETTLPTTSIPKLTGPVLLYHSWSLNPTWYQTTTQPRVLLLEPSHFARFPMSEKRIAFILALAKNIPNLTVVVANFEELSTQNPDAVFCFRHHPAVTHWKGVREMVQPLFAVKYPITSSWSFSKFWSKSSITIKLKDSK